MSAITAIKIRRGRRAARSISPANWARRCRSAPRQTTDEDSFVADNFALLKASGLVEAGVPRELGGGGADVDELAAMLRTLGLSLRLDRARLLHAHPPGRDSGLALDAPEGCAPVEPLLKRIAERAHPPAVERRLGLDRRLRQGREGRGRLSHHRAQDLLLRRARRRPADDRRGSRNRRRAADGAALRHPDELAAREGARHLAHARHARHRLA